LTKLLQELSEKYNVPLKNIIPHRNVANKTCYGNNLSEDWARNLVNEKPLLLKDATIVQLVKRLLELI
jgi:hypothetical protein